MAQDLQPKHVIYDKDGVLLDTEFGTSVVTRDLAFEYLARQGVTPDQYPHITDLHVFAHYAGLHSREKFLGIAGECDGRSFTDDELRVMRVRHREGKANLYLDAKGQVMPGVEAGLQALQGEGILLSVGSSNVSTVSQGSLTHAGLRDYFVGGLYGPDKTDDLNHPSKVKIFEAAIRASGIPANQTVIVGDMVQDADSANALEVDGERIGGLIIVLSKHFGEKSADKRAQFESKDALVIEDYTDMPGKVRQAMRLRV